MRRDEKEYLTSFFKRQVKIYFETNAKMGFETNPEYMEKAIESLVSYYLKNSRKCGYLMTEDKKIIVIKGCDFENSFWFGYSDLGQGDKYDVAYEKYSSFNDASYIKANHDKFEKAKRLAYLEKVTQDLYEYNLEGRWTSENFNLKLSTEDSKRFQKLISDYESKFNKDLIKSLLKKTPYTKDIYWIDR